MIRKFIAAATLAAFLATNVAAQTTSILRKPDNSGPIPADSNGLTVKSSLLEDAPHVSGVAGFFGLAVRNDTASALAGTNGDYIPFTTDSLGRLWTNGSGVTQPVSGTVGISGSVPVTGTFWQTTQPVSGPLTDTQLRASPLGVTGTFWQATQPVSGPLTNTELRAAPIAVTGTFWQASQPVTGTFWQSVQPVSGPLTDTQLRASPVPISGSVTVSGTVNTGGYAQGSTTSGQTGGLTLGAATTAAPTYTNAQTSPLNMTTKGGLRTTAIDAAGNVIAPATDCTGAAAYDGTNNINGCGFARATANAAIDPTPATVNATQIGGVTTAVGNGVSGTGVQRVTLASDSTGVVGISGTLPAFAAIPTFKIDQTTPGTTNFVTANQTQIGGTAVATNNGVVGAGVQRVTIASDSGGQTRITDGTNVASVKAASTQAAPTDTALVVAQSPLPNTVCTSRVAINQTTSTDLATLVAKGHICAIIINSASAQSFSLVEGTGTLCATGTAGIVGGTTASFAVAANGGFTSVADRPWLKTSTTGGHICLLQSGGGNISGVITYADAS